MSTTDHAPSAAPWDDPMDMLLRLWAHNRPRLVEHLRTLTGHDLEHAAARFTDHLHVLTGHTLRPTAVPTVWRQELDRRKEHA